MPRPEQLRKRLQKKANKGQRGFPMATIAYYGPSLGRASKVAVGIIAEDGADPIAMRDWKRETGDVRRDPKIIEEMLDFIELYSALSIILSERIIGCPHQQGIDYEGEWCPECDFWRGRDRFTGKMID